MAKSKGGGKTPGSGRKKGTPNKTTAKRKEIAAKALEDGITPLEIMLATARNLWLRATEAAETKEKAILEEKASAIATTAAPYVHPRLTAVDFKGDITHKTHEEALAELAAEDDD